MMMNIHIYNVTDGSLENATRLARRFSNDYPDRIGIRQCVIYGVGANDVVVYRTKSGRIVVRGNVAS